MAAGRDTPPKALVLFDIDGTLVRRAGPHHREALVEAVRRVSGLESTTDGIPVQGMLDGDILRLMMRAAGVPAPRIRAAMPAVMAAAQEIYHGACPDLRRRVCPGVRTLLSRTLRAGIPIGLVTGNLSRIGWRKLECAGIKDYFLFGAFAEQASSRAALVRIALRQAWQNGWANRRTLISLVGDHPNDILAARRNKIRSIAVATGLSSRDELAGHRPDLLLEDLRALTPAMLRGEGLPGNSGRK
ncbi:MAG: haloacid dehalogenase-like hydrolase [Bryobacteraceae bacterium]|nr:haloacid dehalogenase-like hydrolase [Bryobacteraceae bacterium]